MTKWELFALGAILFTSGCVNSKSNIATAQKFGRVSPSPSPTAKIKTYEVTFRVPLTPADSLVTYTVGKTTKSVHVTSAWEQKVEALSGDRLSIYVAPKIELGKPRGIASTEILVNGEVKASSPPNKTFSECEVPFLQ